MIEGFPVRRLAAVAAALTCFASACRDLKVPAAAPPPGPGTIYGRVVYAIPGLADRVPAAGATVSLLGTSISVAAKSDGSFFLSGIVRSQGALLFRLDSDGDGKADRQKMLQLEDLGAGVGRQIGLGDVVLAENARMHGKVLRGDVPTKGGHGGSTIFIPEGPFTTTSGDDGSYALRDMPEGTLRVTFFRTGYEPVVLDPVDLRAGEDFAVKDVILQPVSGSGTDPGSIAGSVTFDPPVASADGTSVVALDGSGSATAGAVQSDGRFLVAQLPPGLYGLMLSRSGYVTASVLNVLVNPGRESTVPSVILAKVSAGGPDGGGQTDGGGDGGNGDGGGGDGGGSGDGGAADGGCDQGALCPTANPCRLGAVDCQPGGAVCVETGDAPDGTACGSGMVCNTGTCINVCVPQAPCTPADPCHAGLTTCTAGVKGCFDTGTPLQTGAVCGVDKVCAAGACVDCKANLPCTPPNACHAGATSCSTGASVCADSGVDLADGSPCGPSQFCQGGQCGACSPGASCAPANPCHAGAVSCATGRPACADTGVALSDGTGCGLDQVCSGGACIACTAGAACTPSNPCHSGTIACATGQPVCVDQGSLPNGAPCGAGQVCNAGACVACAAGTACTPGNPCHAGAISCTTGTAQCADLGTALADGTGCGPNQVCHSGACAACTSGAACAPTNPCHAGLVSCGTGLPVCGDTGSFLANGAGCGPNMVCNAGSCGACTSGAACAPTNPCHVGAISCATGLPVCGDTAGNVPDGTGCGGGNVCHGGVCGPPGNFAFVFSGDGQSGLVDQTLPTPVVFLFQNGSGGPLATVPVTITAPPGGAAVPATGNTDATGKFTTNVRLGRSVGLQSVTATASGVTTPAIATATANQVADGTIYTLANVAHTGGFAGTPGPATLAQLNYPSGIAVAKDGTVYVSDQSNHLVKRISPAGDIVVVAGNGSGGFSGDSGPATAAQLSSPRGLALDEANGFLFIADGGNLRVRQVDFASGKIFTYAGGGGTGAPLYGDGGTADLASFGTVTHLVLGPETPPALYVTDYGHGRIRRIDPVTRIVTLFFGHYAGANCSSALDLIDCGGESGCNVAFDADGTAFIGADLCGGLMGGNYINGVVRRSPSGALTPVAGYATGTASEGINARSAYFYSSPHLALDAFGNLFVMEWGTQTRLRRIDGASGRIDTIAGGASQGAGGDYGPASAATFRQMFAMVLDPVARRDLYVADEYNHSIRLIRNAGATGAPAATLSVGGGGAQSALLDQIASTLLTAKLTDAGGAALQGYSVDFASLTAGGALYASSALTGLAGTASVQARLGLSAQAYQFQARFTDLHGHDVAGSPVSFSATAGPPQAGNIFNVLNDDHVAGTPGGYGGPATLQRVSYPTGVAANPNGTLYVSLASNHVVVAIAPNGLLTRIAGTGAAGFNGDGALATDAMLNGPRGLAFDPVANKLYLADFSNARVRVVDLATGFINTVAGGGGAGGPLYGDGAALSANLSNPSHIRLHGGSLFIADTGHSRVRQLDLASNLVSTVVYNSAGCGTAAVNLLDCAGEYGCDTAWDSSGRLYVSGDWCGNPMGGNYIQGVIRVDPGPLLVPVVGVASGTQGEGVLGTATLLPTSGALAFDGADNLYMTLSGSHVVRYLRSSDQRVYTWTGTNGSPGYAGNYAPFGAGALYNQPWDLLLSGYGGHAVIADEYNHVVRVIW